MSSRASPVDSSFNDQSFSIPPDSPVTTPLTPLKREYYKNIWNHYQWNKIVDFDQLVDNYPDFFNLLRDSKILYTIRCYQHTFQEEGEFVDLAAEQLKQAFIVDFNGHPSLYKEGQWVRWDQLRKEIEYSQDKKQIVSKGNSDICWNYVYPNGFVPEGNRGYLKPIYQLGATSLQTLKAFAKTTDEKKHIIQVFTTQANHLQRISHAGLRLVTADGQVYSHSFVTPDDEITMDEASPFDFLATYNVDITAPDFVETDKFLNRYVTSIPITDDQLNVVLKRIEGYTQESLRFNFIHQNCATFVSDVFTSIDLPIDATYWVGGFFWDIAQGIPCLGPLLQIVDKVARGIINFLGMIIPKFIRTPILFVAEVITYIPYKILTILRNFLILILGGAKIGTPPRPGMVDHWDNEQRLTGFNRLINSWTDVFKDSPGKIYSTGVITHWQKSAMKEQTYTHCYDGSPKFTIAPPVSTTPTA